MRARRDARHRKPVLDASVVKGIKDVGDVAAVDVVPVGVDDDGARDGELVADEAATGSVDGRVAERGVCRCGRR